MSSKKSDVAGKLDAAAERYNLENSSLGEIVRELNELTVTGVLSRINPIFTVGRHYNVESMRKARQEALYRELDRRELEYRKNSS